MIRRFLLFFLILISFQNSVFAQCVGTPNPFPQTLPSGLGSMMILSANQNFNAPSFNTSDPLINPNIAGNIFDQNVMGRNTAAQAVQRQLALDYFVNQFGVDFNDSVTASPNSGGPWFSNDNHWALVHYTVEPIFNQRIVYASGETMPTDGWLVNQGYYRMVALDAQASTMGAWGDLDSRFIPPGSFADFGEMRIEKRVPCSTSGFQATTFIDLNYESTRPNFPDYLSAFGPSKGYQGSRANIDYLVTQESSALQGTARGRLELKDLGSDNYSAEVRMILKLS